MKNIRKSLVKLVHRHKKHLGIGGLATVVLLSSIFYYNCLLRSRAVQFSYSKATCFSDITFLPGLYHAKGVTGTYNLEVKNMVGWKKYILFSRTTCVGLRHIPAERSTDTLNFTPLNNPIIKKRFRVAAAPLPKLETTTLREAVSIKHPLQFHLDQPDKFFDYYVEVAGKQTKCRQSNKILFCDLNSLQLTQGKRYDMGVYRYFAGQKAATITRQAVTTISPVNIVASSVEKGAIVYNIPTEIHLTADKSLNSAQVVLRYSTGANERKDIEQTTTVADKEITIKLAKPLPRNVTAELSIEQIEAKDSATLDQVYMVPFKVSGGPQVVATNLKKSSTDPRQAIVLTFDQDIASAQDFSKIVSLKSNGAASAFTATVEGRKLTIRPTTSLPLCSPMSIELNNNLKSVYGIEGNSAWSIKSRIICYTISTIGYSVRGRPIVAWRFGTGASKILYVGTTHGNEKSTKYLLDTWITNLEANPDKIPANRSIIVIPNLNPDGFASSARTNAAGVDLNRNFPAFDWKPDVTMPRTALIKNGGGTGPLSEPESRSLANFILSERPRLVLTYHAIASVVSANESGDSVSLAARYASLSRYLNLPSGETDTVFQYDTTGAFENWLHDRVGIAALLVEVESYTVAPYSRNSAAMWLMAQLP